MKEYKPTTYHSNVWIDESKSQQSMTSDSKDNGNEYHKNVSTNFVD